ncbi:MSCRAMM family protein [Natronobeatus ordinarius]|uniref:MSCRAMM family protein n=1 Tax=Natronobeatus ordinarius TaxID=2963433 RepID=UPI0020CB90BD|nr:carboxypeptidase regulatory-like domain-containing protein [Natronobeatus ordinarius]
MSVRRVLRLLGVFLIVGCVVLAGGVIGAAADGSTGPIASGPAERGGTALSNLQETSSEEGSLGPNLLDNPQCIVDGQGEGEEPLYWTVEQGELECNEPENQFMPDPIEGEYVFIDWEDLEPSTDESVATQTVPVTGGSGYQFSVWVGSDDVTDDYAQFEVQFLDDGTPIDDGLIDSGEFQPEDHTEPDQFVETTVAPENADEAVVRIILVNGGDFDLDRPLLWADDVRLQEFSDAPTAFDVDGVETGIEQTLAPDWTLFDDEFGEDEDDRGFDDSGELTHFGGGDLGGSVTDNAAGETVGLAGGDLQVNADGSFSLTNPTQTGTFAFEYRLGYEGDHDDAAVEIEILDHELENPLCDEWDSNAQDQPIGWDGESISCHDLEDLPWTDTDHTAVGERSFTDNYILLDDEVHTEQTVYVVGGETYTVSGLYGTDSDDYSGEVEFEYLDSDGHVIADEGFTLEDLQSESTTDFDRFTETTDAPDDAKRATLRLTVVRPSGHEDPAGVYFDDLSIEDDDPSEDPVNARDVETEVGIYHTFDPDDTLFDDWGNGVDELGTPEAELVNFGGGDLSGSVTDHDPGEEMSFAGGTLTVEADGSFSLEEPTDVGAHTFEYEIENEHDSSTATVEIWVRDSTLFDTDCDPDSFDAWDDVSPSGGGIGCIDPQRSGEVDPNGEQNPPVPPYAIGDTVGDGEDASAEQTVPVRPGFTYELAGYVGTEETPEDSYVTLEVDYLDEDGTVLTVDEEADVDLSEMRSEETTEFDAFSDTTVAPEDATHATVRIHVNNAAEMDLGGDAYARAYVDDLSFDLLGTPPEANDADLEVDAADTLTTSVVEDHGHGADDLGEPDAEVVSFGGGDLAGDATEYNAGQTTALAGGDLTIESDGSLEFVAPTEPGTFAFDYRLENDAGYDEATVTIEVESLTVDGTVTDAVADGEPGIADATVTLDHEDSEESYETETASDGSYELAVGQVGEFVLTVEASGYEMKSAPITLDGGDETRDVGLTGNASVSGTVSDTTFETGIEDIEVAVENGLGAYTAETDDNGEYTVESVPGTGEEYAVTVDPTGWDGNSTTVTIDDGDDVTDVDFEITGDGRDSIALSDWKTGEPLEGATVRIEHETFGVAEDAFTADGDGNMKIVLPGGFTYGYTFSQPGYDPVEIPVRSFGPGDELSANYVLGGNAEIDGKITDAETGGGIGGATVTAQNGTGAYEATTSADGTYTIENVPGGHDYDVEIEADGYDTVVESDESVGDEATHTLDAELTGTATLSGTVTDETFGADLDGVEVEVSGEQEYVVETDENGEYTATVAGTGEEYVVTVDPDGWGETSETIELGDGETETDVDFELAGDAAIELTVEDAETGSPIDGATVIVTNGTLGESDSFETDDDGAAELAPLPGGFTYDFTIEADGYDDGELTDVFLTEDTSASRTHGLFGNAGITGQVTDEVTGGPVDGATVTAENGAGTYETTTDEGGEYSLENLPGTGEAYDVAVDAEGYESVQETVAVGDEASEVRAFVVSGDAELTGTVTDALTGEGIDGATVTAENGAGAYEATTDEDGKYTIENVPGEETYELTAAHEAYETASRAGVAVDAGEQQTENLEFEPVGRATVVGTVSDEVTGAAVADATVIVELDDAATEIEYETTTDADGGYEVDEVISGYGYTVTVVANGYERVSEATTVDTDGTIEVDVTAAGNASVSGIVEDEATGAAVPDAVVVVAGEQGEYIAEMNASGEFSVEQVAGTGESYELSASAPGYATTTMTLEVGDGDVLEDVLVELPHELAPYADDDGIVQTDGLRNAIDDWRSGSVDTNLLRAAVDAWKTGDPID